MNKTNIFTEVTRLDQRNTQSSGWQQKTENVDTESGDHHMKEQ